MLTDFDTLPESQLTQLGAVVEGLANNHVLKAYVKVHNGYREARAKPGSKTAAKAVRDAQKVVVATSLRLGLEQGASVQMMVIARLGDYLEPDARLSAVDELPAMKPGLIAEVFRARYGYPALLEMGKTYAAERLVQNAHELSVAKGDPLLLAEARLLLVRHLLWIGQIEAAEDELTQALSEWADLGLPAAVPFLRQRRAVRLLSGLPVPQQGSHAEDRRLVARRQSTIEQQVLTKQARSPELAVRFARSGDTKRGVECLEASLQMIGAEHLSLSDQAQIAMASRLLEHEKGSLLAYDLLQGSGDKLIGHADGSLIFGPASLYAGLAAASAGMDETARENLGRARSGLDRFGGSQAAMDTVLQDTVLQDGENDSAPIFLQ